MRCRNRPDLIFQIEPVPCCLADFRCAATSQHDKSNKKFCLSPLPESQPVIDRPQFVGAQFPVFNFWFLPDVAGHKIFQRVNLDDITVETEPERAFTQREHMVCHNTAFHSVEQVHPVFAAGVTRMNVKSTRLEPK